MEIWLNPDCSKCRTAVAELDAAGVSYTVRRYLDDPPSAAELEHVLARLGLEPWDITRTGEQLAGELGVAGWPREAGCRDRWLGALANYPQLIQRPIITADAVKMIDDRVKQAIAKGAKAHTGARYDGQIYYPTILTDVPLDAAIANEETFGPVVVVEVVDTPDEAIAAANRTLYGLTSSILAGNTYRAFEMAPKVLAGIVNVNSPTVNDEIHAPMGGVRDSGWGRTGPRSLEDFSDVIWINAHSGQRQCPF